MNKIKNITAVYSFVIAGTFLSIVFALYVFIINTVSYGPEMAQTMTFAIAYPASFISMIIISMLCARTNTTKNPGDTSKNMMFYLKRMFVTAVLLILMNYAVIVVDWVVDLVLGIQMEILIDSSAIRGFLLTLPSTVIYLCLIFKMFIHQGFADCTDKIYNPKFTILSMMVVFTAMITYIVRDGLFLAINIQTDVNPDSVMLYWGIFVAAIVLIFAVQTAAALFAYNNGKQHFKQKHPRILDEYAIFEND